MDIPAKYLDKKIYLKAKAKADATYKKPSAYKSAYIVKQYREMGGKIKQNNKPSNLKKWFVKEKWVNLTPYAEGLTTSKTKYKCGEKAPNQTKKSVCRPTEKVKDFSKKQIKKAIDIKEKGKVIKWDKL